MKFQDDISFGNIIVAKFKYPKFTKRAITQKMYDFFQFFIKYSIHHPLSASISLKFLADAAFTKFHPFVFSKGRNFTRGDTFLKFRFVENGNVFRYCHGSSIILNMSAETGMSNIMFSMYFQYLSFSLFFLDLGF